MRWHSQLNPVHFSPPTTIARLTKNIIQFLLAAIADAEKQGVFVPYLEPDYDILLIGLMQLSSQPPVWQPILEIMRPTNHVHLGTMSSHALLMRAQ